MRRVEGDGSLIQEEGRFQGALGSELVTGEPGGRRVLEESSQRPRHQGVEKVPQAGSPEQVWANHGGRTREEQGAPPPPLARAPGSTHGRPVSELTASPCLTATVTNIPWSVLPSGGVCFLTGLSSCLWGGPTLLPRKASPHLTDRRLQLLEGEVSLALLLPLPSPEALGLNHIVAWVSGPPTLKQRG